MCPLRVFFALLQLHLLFVLGMSGSAAASAGGAKAGGRNCPFRSWGVSKATNTMTTTAFVAPATLPRSVAAARPPLSGATAAVADEGGFDLNEFPNVQRWVARVESDLGIEHARKAA